MKFTYPGIDKTIDTDEERVNCLVIENRKFLSEMIEDIYGQVVGGRGKAVLSENGKIVDFTKYCDLTTSFFPFEINRKSLITKILTVLEKNSQTPANFEKTAEFLSFAENYLNDLSLDLPCDLVYNKINVSSILKAVGVEICDDSTDLPEKILNYMELVREFEGEKLFIVVNLRSFVDDEAFSSFLESVIMHKYALIPVDAFSFPAVPFENRLTVDNDLCCF